MPGLTTGAENVLLGQVAVPSLFKGPPLIALAAGDLDQVPDAEGINHDEVAVAWASNVSADQSSVDVDLAVVNYASGEPLVTVLRRVLQAQFPVLQSPDELFAVAMGDFAGDGQRELALAAITGQGQRLQLQIYRYSRASLGSAPVLTKKSDTTFDALELAAGLDFTPTISLAAGDFKGDGKKDELILALNGHFPPHIQTPAKTFLTC
jgi:hypothetical protein